MGLFSHTTPKLTKEQKIEKALAEHSKQKEQDKANEERKLLENTLCPNDTHEWVNYDTRYDPSPIGVEVHYNDVCAKCKKTRYYRL